MVMMMMIMDVATGDDDDDCYCKQWSPVQPVAWVGAWHVKQ